MWRPKDWNNPYKPNHFYTRCKMHTQHRIFEGGADTMLEAAMERVFEEIEDKESVIHDEKFFAVYRDDWEALKSKLLNKENAPSPQ